MHRTPPLPPLMVHLEPKVFASEKDIKMMMNIITYLVPQNKIHKSDLVVIILLLV